MRSKLFVPGSRPELFAKALAGQADALSFDLEDSVSEPRKAEARLALRELLRSDAARSADKTLIVRINALDTPHWRDDLAAVVQPGLDLVNLPKPTSIDDVVAAAQALEQAEQANGLDNRSDTGRDSNDASSPGDGAGSPSSGRSGPGSFKRGTARKVGLLLNIESPQALADAARLARAHPRVVGLQLGLGDLFEPLGVDRREPTAIAQAMFALRMAAAAAGVFAYDGAFANIGDPEGYRAEAALARRLGFLGKSCIHPSQVALANDAFQPGADEIAHALKVLAAAKDAEARGVGAFVVDGRMIDAPFIARAEQVLALARRLKMIPA